MEVILCHICGITLPSKSKPAFEIHLLETHRKEVDPPLNSCVKIFNCPDCNYSTNNSGNYWKHVVVHSDLRKFQCSFCDKTFKRKNQLYTHFHSHTKEKPLFCKNEQCEYSCSDYTVMKRHVEKEHPSPQTEAKKARESEDKMCALCGFKAQFSAYDLKSHMRTHTGEQLWACYLCPYKTGFSGALQRHVRTHTGLKPYACKMCPYKSATSSHLKRHQKKHLRSN